MFHGNDIGFHALFLQNQPVLNNTDETVLQKEKNTVLTV